jgi:hypothetical protein
MLLRVTWSTLISETEIVKRVCDTLASKLPSDWKLVEREEARTSRARAHVIFELRAPDGGKATIFIKAKRKLEPRGIPKLLEQLKRYKEGTPLVVSDFLTPRAREILTERGVGYADATGNFRLALSKPALLIETKGTDRDPWPDGRPLKSLKGHAAGRVVRALCDLEPPFAVREVAVRAGVSPASASRVLTLLDREAIIERNGSRVVNRVAKADLIRRWVREYSLLGSNRADNFLEPRGIPALLTKLRPAKFKYAVTGALPVSWVLSSMAPPRVVTIFVENIPKTADAMDLRRAETGTNVILVEPFDDVVFERTWERDGIRCVALSQLCADLLSGPGRDPNEGEELLKNLGGSEITSRAFEKRVSTR